MEISNEEVTVVLPALAERTRLEIMVGVLQHRLRDADDTIEELRQEIMALNRTLQGLAQGRPERINTQQEDYQ